MRRPRVLAINPNTSRAVTELIIRNAERRGSPRFDYIPATARFGASYIASRAGMLVGEMAAIQLLAEGHTDADVVWLCCFGDPGLDALREVSPIPVIGMAEPAMRAAAARARRFSIVTGGRNWGPMLSELAAKYRLSHQLASIRTLDGSAGELRSNRERTIEELAAACVRCVREDGAEAVVLGGAGFVDLVDQVRETVGSDVLVACPLEESVREINNQLTRHRSTDKSHFRSDDAEWTGLSAELTRLLSDDRGTG